MFYNFGINVAKIFKNAEKEMLDLCHPYVGSEHLLLSILASDDEIVDILKKHQLTYDNFKKELLSVVGKSGKKSSCVLYTPLLKRIIDIALNDSKENNSGLVTPRHLFLGILEEGEGIAVRLMIGMNIDVDNLYQKLKLKQSNNKNNLLIFEIGNVLNSKVNKEEKVIGRDNIITNIIEILLRKSKNNPLLIGEAGVGKTAIIEELTRWIELDKVPPELANKKVVMLEMSFLVAGTKYRGEFEEKLTKIIDEVKNNNEIILFIDEIHTLVGAGGAEGAIDASNILKPYLARGDIKCIGATTIAEYNKTILKDKALERRFQVINVLEPNEEETLNILNGIKHIYEEHHHLKISNENIKDIVLLSNKYINDKYNPDKCIDVLDSVCAKVKLQSKIKNNKQKQLNKVIIEKNKSIFNNDLLKALKFKEQENQIIKEQHKSLINKIYKRDIIEVIATKTNTVLLTAKVLQKIKQDFKNKVVGQENKYQIIETIKNYKSNKPVSILINGPTGVGKTYTAKIIAEALGNNYLKIDMGEFNTEISVSKLIGTSQGYIGYNDDHLFSNIKNKQVIILDEIDKASKKVLNLFLNILDEGYIKDAKGNQISFYNKIIVMTANGYQSNLVGFNNTIKKQNHILTKEFLSRISKIITYQAITREEIKYYLINVLNIKDEMEIDEIIKNTNYEEQGLRNIMLNKSKAI